MTSVAAPKTGAGSTGPAQTSPEFVKAMTLTDATMLVAGSMIGSGIFIVSASMARTLISPFWLLVAWVVTGVITLLGWVVALVTGRQGIALVMLTGWWLLTVIGLLLLARWLPSGGKHSEDTQSDAWGSGAGLSVLGHVGMLVGVGYFTFVAVTDRL